MQKIALLALSLVALAMAGDKSYSFTLYQPALLGSTKLMPGEYKVSIDDQKAVVRNGKIHGEAPVKIESGDARYDRTTVRFENGDGQMHIQEIRVGGTKTKLVFSE